ncbi:MAG: tRNA threonylcarbamoyladenosine dehydratase [Clostridium sp.]|nr:tRNA threonylcarbamoyladenosine dehydratase [Clostridium sp.]
MVWRLVEKDGGRLMDNEQTSADSREWQQRTELLLGGEKTGRLARSRVLVVGVGGVGGYAAEMLVRAGVGRLTLMDADSVQPSNINRQLCALHSTVGRNKVEVLAERFRDINPNVELDVRPVYLEAGAADDLVAEGYDFVVDAIDTIAPKCALIEACLQRRVPVVCSMGAGAKTDASQIRFANLWETYHCGLSKAVRTRLKADGWRGARVPVVFCTQQADRNSVVTVEGERNKKSTAGSIGYLTAVFGCYLAQYVLERL